MSSSVKVIKCSDPMYWYSEHVGEAFTVVYTFKVAQEWVVRAADGCTNIIKFKDGELIDG